MGKRMTNATQTIDQPASVVYDNRADYTGLAIVAVVTVLLSCPIAWWAGTFLFDRAGYYEPDKALANTILTGVGVIVTLAVTIGVGTVIAQVFLSKVLAHRERIAELENVRAATMAEAARWQQVTAQRALPSGRMNEEHIRWSKLIQAVMFQAYDHLTRTGPYRYNEGYPWSREAAKEVVLAGERAPVGYEMGNKVRDWLRQYDVIIQDGKTWQINVGRFPDLGSIEALLYRLYDVPVIVSGSITAPIRDNAGWKFVEE